MGLPVKDPTSSTGFSIAESKFHGTILISDPDSVGVVPVSLGHTGACHYSPAIEGGGESP